MKRLDGFEFVTLRNVPELRDAAAEWFHARRGVPKDAYLECMDSYLHGDTEYGRYLCLCGGRIAGGLSVIENDFRCRKDLSPNICAVYTDPQYRCRGIAGELPDMAVVDLKAKGIPRYICLPTIPDFTSVTAGSFCAVCSATTKKSLRVCISAGSGKELQKNFCLFCGKLRKST